MVADDVARLPGIRAEQIAIVYNGVDCQRFSPDHRARYREVVRRRLGVADATLVLLLAAHNFRLKGVPELLSATAQLVANQRTVHVVIAGGKHLVKWQRAAERLGLRNHVTFLGMVADMVPWYAAADAYIHPTYYDPCSLVILEAAASGLPIVTTRRFNGAAELFRDGESILTLNGPSDQSALVESINALFDERLREMLGSAARNVAVAHPFEKNVAEILRLYDRRVPRWLAA
jgi:UDP-glucose:(heptosyl)LPS alpha-1,3-glucosyltransferase